MSDDCEHEYVMVNEGWICKHCKKSVYFDPKYKRWLTR